LDTNTLICSVGVTWMLHMTMDKKVNYKWEVFLSLKFIILLVIAGTSYPCAKT